jgi:hypothetical protein
MGDKLYTERRYYVMIPEEDIKQLSNVMIPE